MDLTCLEPGSCAIKSFDISGFLESNLADRPYDWARDGSVLGWGLRNSVGIGESSDGGIYSVENSADELVRNGQDIHRDNPAEELNYHGRLGSNNPLQGRNFGYPTCFAAWDAGVVRGLSTGDQFALETNATFTDATCQQRFERPRLSFQAHTAPLDIKFYRPEGTACERNLERGGLGCNYRDSAFVTFHGSWNREELVGYSVAEVPFTRTNDGFAPRAVSTSRDEPNHILSARDIARCPDNCFRPTGMTFNRDGALYVTGDSTGDILVLLRTDRIANANGGNPRQGDDTPRPSASSSVKVGTWGVVASVVAGALLSMI
jgi:glucose/arabinose dehydrogenase